MSTYIQKTDFNIFVSVEGTTSTKKVKNDQHDETEKRKRYLDYQKKVTSPKSEPKNKQKISDHYADFTSWQLLFVMSEFKRTAVKEEGHCKIKT